MRARVWVWENLLVNTFNCKFDKSIRSTSYECAWIVDVFVLFFFSSHESHSDRISCDRCCWLLSKYVMVERSHQMLNLFKFALWKMHNIICDSIFDESKILDSMRQCQNPMENSIYIYSAIFTGKIWIFSSSARKNSAKIGSSKVPHAIVFIVDFWLMDVCFLRVVDQIRKSSRFFSAWWFDCDAMLIGSLPFNAKLLRNIYLYFVHFVGIFCGNQSDGLRTANFHNQ